MYRTSQIKEFNQNIQPVPRVKKELEDFNHLYKTRENRIYDVNRVLEEARKNRTEADEKEEKRKEGKVVRFWGMVGIKDIADILYGMENNGVLTIVDANSKKMYAEVAKRISPCIWDGRRIPQDYVNRAIMKASNPLAYKDRKNWERVLTLACSFIKKAAQKPATVVPMEAAKELASAKVETK